MKSNFFLLIVLLALISTANAQVKIGNNPTTIDANSLLELESTNKGFLPPRVSINDLNAVSPLTGTVPVGMLVYSSGGTVGDGYYSWDGSKWVPFITGLGEVNVVTKTVSATLLKSETFVIASGEITLTLPAIVAADNGLAITIKHVGTYTDEVDVIRNGSSTIDGTTNTSKHFRWMAKTYIASGGNWLIKGNENRADNVFDVSPNGSWTTIAEVIAFLNLHMVAPSVVRLISGNYPIASTLTINLPFPLTIQGTSYGAATITAGGGLSGAMFICESESYFKMLAFDATGYSDDAIHLDTNPEYYEVKDCTFDGFDKAIVASTNVEFWVFEVDIINAGTAGIELAAGAASGVSFKISETDFIDCAIGINLLSGPDPVVSILNCGFYNAVSGVGINYVPASFTLTSASTLFATNNTWNNVGTFMSGFDFSLASGRDANTFIQNNSGGQNKNPHCRINVNSNASITFLNALGTWYKGELDPLRTTSTTTKWTIGTNRITYQPVNRSDGWAIITGNIEVDASPRVISIAIVKNGMTTTRYGETDLRIVTANQPFQFATSVYLSDIGPGDYFEVFATSVNNNFDEVVFRDLQWFTETK